MKKREIPGVGFGSYQSSVNYADNVVLGAERGHGFAAEKANHLKDVFHGEDATIVGGDNARNGADRLVNGVEIQTKYCASGSKCVSDCFTDGKFRYFSSDGTPMKIEVPSDKYESAVQAMKERIKRGQIKGITNPDQAKEIVKKGSFTYQQVRNTAKFGTIESLTYDAVNGIKLAGSAMGISAAISFAIATWNGEDWDVALKSSIYTGLKVGGTVWLGSIITAQLGRTGIEQSLRSSTDWIVKEMGAKAAAWLANNLSGKAIYGAAAMNHVSKLLRGNVITGVVTTLAISSVDFVRIFQGKISGAQAFKNVARTGSSVAGGTGGWMGGAATGAVLGSVAPIIGTKAGGIIGGIAGALTGGVAAQKASEFVFDSFIEDDSKEMLRILERVLGEVETDYLLTEAEASKAGKSLKNRHDIPDLLRNMYASDNRSEFAKEKIETLVKNIISSRDVIILPSDEEIIVKAGEIIEELVATA
jgi:hypothetical protein